MRLCHKNSRIPDQEEQQNNIFVTAASEVYVRCLWQLLKSARRHKWREAGKFLVYDLGLSASSVQKTRLLFPWCEIRSFDFAKWPDHAALQANTYAWKVFLISTVVKYHRGNILWLDSATILRSSANEILRITERDGIYTLRGQAPLAARCDSNVLKLLKVPLEFLDKPERAAGVIGLNTRNQAVRQLAAAWLKLAGHPEYIPPRNRGHNPEQALLSILLFKFEAAGLLRLQDDDIDISSPKPVRWMSSRNLVSNRLPLAFDPIIRLGFYLYKIADQWVIAGKIWYGRRIKGLHRWPKEDYEVFFKDVTEKSSRSIKIMPKRFSYYADPFTMRHLGCDYVLLEEFRYGENRGELVYVRHEGDGHFSPPAPILNLSYHASFPYVFRHRGKIYLLPETSANKSIDIYVAEDFPRKWRLYQRLMYGVDAADSIIFPRGGKWWLITSERAHGTANRSLAIYWSNTLKSTRWHAHPINNSHLYGSCRFGYGRNAGGLIRRKNTVLRPMQKNVKHYGEAIQLMEIRVLTQTQFEEIPYVGKTPQSLFLARNNLHHIANDRVTTFDRRIRVPFFRAPLRQIDWLQ